MDYLGIITSNILNGEVAGVKKNIVDALGIGFSAQKILDDSLIPGMNEVGKKWKNNEYFLPDVLLSAAVMQSAMEILKPRLPESGQKYKATVVIGTIKGDVHDIGKNMVGMMLEGAGYKVIDLGINVDPEKFLSEAKNNNAQIVGMSALLSSTMVAMKDVVEIFNKSDLKGKVKIIAGGAPITKEFADSIGCDGYAKDAALAVDKVKELLSS
ncbi:MAG: cobalamin B12-binding domain-containing protein [Candidatus Humimicrobiaceae bacterium]